MPSVTDANCVASCNGTATLNISGGSGSYTYNWSSGSADSSYVDDLCVGVTNVLVTDSLGCTVSQAITINENNTIFGTAITTDATCGACDGDATVTPSGGLGSYTVLWSDGSTGTTIDSLCAGVYSYTVTDSVGCSATIDVAISNVDGPTSAVVNVADVTCFGDSDGTADITPAGGTPPYTYLWVPGGSTSSSITGLAEGSYSVEVMDSNGCILVETAVVGSPGAIAIESLVINEDCGLSNGSIEIVPVGGVAPYTYTWTGGLLPPDSIQTGLTAGIYQVAVTDFSGCSDTFDIAVNAVNGPTVSLTSEDVSCFDSCDGIGTVVASGGSGFFSYQWSNGGSNAADSTLCSGMHTITVIDDTTGCITTSFVVIAEPDSLSMSFPNLVNATCFGLCNGSATVVASGGTLPYSYSWPSTGTSASDSLLCADTLTVSITDASGCTQSEEVIILEPELLTIALDSIDASCTGIADGGVNAVVAGGTPSYSYSWTGPTSPLPDNDTIIDLLSGTYILTVTDSLGCQAIDSTVVNDTIFVEPFAGLDTAICFGTGPITLTGTGLAASFEWYDINGALISAADTLDVDSTGCYVLMGIDGICSNYDTVCVVIDSLPVPDAGDDYLLISGESVVIGGSPTTDPLFDVVWMPPNYLDDTTAMNPLVMAIDTPTVYIVMVTDTNGCVGYDTVFVDLYPNIFAPGGITPNGDGINDDWEIDFIGEYPDCQVEVYNRWGQQLFYNQGYTQRWDGRYNGKDLPEGTYYYVIRLNHPAYPEPYTGPVTILR
tara:strand:- start:274 stop:2601 length:2328 start_codon:yes stop_codon:yes gene_type:complete